MPSGTASRICPAMNSFAEPFNARVNELLADSDALDDLLAEGARRARALAAPMLAQVYDRVGFIPGKS